jgi:hypothetical protein
VLMSSWQSLTTATASTSRPGLGTVTETVLVDHRLQLMQARTFVLKSMSLQTTSYCTCTRLAVGRTLAKTCNFVSLGGCRTTTSALDCHYTSGRTNLATATTWRRDVMLRTEAVLTERMSVEWTAAKVQTVNHSSSTSSTRYRNLAAVAPVAVAVAVAVAVIGVGMETAPGVVLSTCNCALFRNSVAVEFD